MPPFRLPFRLCLCSHCSLKVNWTKLREERGQPFLCLTLDLWSTAKARDSFGCICASFIDEAMKVDRAAHIRSVQVCSLSLCLALPRSASLGLARPRSVSLSLSLALPRSLSLCLALPRSLLLKPRAPLACHRSLLWTTQSQPR